MKVSLCHDSGGSIGNGISSLREVFAALTPALSHRERELFHCASSFCFLREQRDGERNIVARLIRKQVCEIPPICPLSLWERVGVRAENTPRSDKTPTIYIHNSRYPVCKPQRGKPPICPLSLWERAGVRAANTPRSDFSIGTTNNKHPMQSRPHLHTRTSLPCM